MLRMDSIKAALRAPFIPKLTTEESVDLPSYVSRTQTSIFELQRHIADTRTNLLTIARCIKSKLPSTTDSYKSFSEYGIFDLPRAIADLEETYSQISINQQILRHQMDLKRKATFPVQLIERPVVIPDSERMIAMPLSMNRVYVTALAMSAEGHYYLLKVKKQEVQLELEKLKADVKRWGDIYEHMASSERQARSHISTSPSFSSTQPTPRNSVGRSYMARHDGGILDFQRYENAIATKRKPVPVRDIVARTMRRADQLKITFSQDDGTNELSQDPCQDPMAEEATRNPGVMTIRGSPNTLVGPRPPPRAVGRPSVYGGVPFVMPDAKDVGDVAVQELGMNTARPAMSMRGSSQTLRGGVVYRMSSTGDRYGAIELP